MASVIRGVRTIHLLKGRILKLLKIMSSESWLGSTAMLRDSKWLPQPDGAARVVYRRGSYQDRIRMLEVVGELRDATFYDVSNRTYVREHFQRAVLVPGNRCSELIRAVPDIYNACWELQSSSHVTEGAFLNSQLLEGTHPILRFNTLQTVSK